MASLDERMLPVSDSFAELARYYDPLMAHVNYDRWYAVTGTIASLLPTPFAHADLACGTGTLVKKLRRTGWTSYGFDLSQAMLRAWAKGNVPAARAAADLRALPLRESVDYVTCLFDSVNFLLDLEDVRQAFRETYGAIKKDGLFYFDVVTEKMVLDHFAGQSWSENNGPFSTTWDTQYSRKTSTAETHIKVSQGPLCTIRERVYTLEEIADALQNAGFEVLGALDAETWKAPSRRTVRIDFVAAKGEFQGYAKQFKAIQANVRKFFA